MSNLSRVKKVRYLLIIFLISVLSFLPLVRKGFYSMQDDLQAFRLHQMNQCFSDFQIPCRWVPDMGYGYGYPQFNFYAPGVYYLGELIHLLGFQFIDTTKILFILGFILSSLAMFILVNEFFGAFPALVSSFLYTYAPFKAVQVYVRGSLGEFYSFVFFPLIFWSSYKLIKERKRVYIIYCSLSWALFLITHNLTPYIFAPLFLLWVLFWIYFEKKYTSLKYITLSILIAFLLSSFFVIPMVLERKYVHIETLLGGYFDYRRHFVSLKQMFFKNNWGYGSSDLGPDDDVALYSGIMHWLPAFVSGLLAFFHFKKKKRIVYLTFFLLGCEMVVLFLMHLKSAFIWDRIYFLKWLQFPWRFLTVSVFLLSFLSSFLLFYLGKLKYFFGILIIIISSVLYLGFFKPKDWFYITDKEKFSGYAWERQLTISIFDYLPIYAVKPPENKATDKPEILDGEAKVISYKKGSDYQEGLIEVEKSVRIRLPLFDFPGMRVEVDNIKVSHINNDCRGQKFCLGLITFDLNEGEHEFKAFLKDTPPRRLGNYLSLFGILMTGFILTKHEKIRKN